MGNMALYTVIDRETNKTVCVNKTSRDLTLLIGIDADRVHQYAKSQNAYKRRWLIYKSGSRVGYDPSKETLRHEWDKTVKWILTGEKQEERKMLAYGVKDIVMDHVICRNAPLAEVARRTGAPAGKIPSMAKGGRLHDGRYLIWVEGELEDIIDQKFREDWDTTRKSVLHGLAEAYKRGES